MLRPEYEALLHGAIDGTLSAGERETLRLLIRNDSALRERAAELDQVNNLLASLGPAEAPPDLVEAVLARLTPSPHVRAAAAPQPAYQFSRRSIPKRGVIVNKKMIFALAAAAVVVLAVITYTSYPPATTGTEATIGAAQRAQTPQMAPADVTLADQSTQELLQSETWDAIMKDEELRSTLQDAEVRRQLQDPELRRALENEAVKRFLRDPQATRRLADQELVRRITDAELARKLNDANLDAALRNEAFLRALRSQPFRDLVSRGGAKALANDSMARVLRDARFEAALRSDRFGAQLARR